MKRTPTFDERATANESRLSPAERRVLRFFQDNREEVLVGSAMALAAKARTSDATVVRTAKALGFAGLDELRRQLADELRLSLSPASRVTRTLGDVGGDIASALATTIEIHRKALDALQRDVTTDLFRTTIERLVTARRVFVFGIGPSSAVADYFAIQLGRFGFDGISLKYTGLLLADGLHRLRRGDFLFILAYGRVYRELAAMLDHTDRLRIPKCLVTDTLGPALRERVDLVLPVARGRTDRFSMHAATLCLLEALLVGVAAKRPSETVFSLKQLNDLRSMLVGPDMDLPASGMDLDLQRGEKPSRRRR